MLLGFILESIATLETQFDTMRLQMGGIQDLQFNPPALWKSRTAPTRLDPWRERLLVGEVDDDNAWALGGAAGHAGLFGAVASVGECARHWLQVLEGRTGVFTQRRADVRHSSQRDHGSSRALGWDTMLPTSSCGTRMSPRAFGHVGFTGTSLWIDPDRSVYVALLTNRVHPSPDNQAIARVRPALHDAMMDEFEESLESTGWPAALECPYRARPVRVRRPGPPSGCPKRTATVRRLGSPAPSPVSAPGTEG